MVNMSLRLLSFLSDQVSLVLDRLEKPCVIFLMFVVFKFEIVFFNH